MTVKKKKRKWKRRTRRDRELAKLIADQKRDMWNFTGIDNTYNPKSQDIYSRRRRSGGSGFKRH